MEQNYEASVLWELTYSNEEHRARQLRTFNRVEKGSVPFDAPLYLTEFGNPNMTETSWVCSFHRNISLWPLIKFGHHFFLL